MKVVLTEIQGNGLEALLGKKVILYCMNYFYAGTLTGVNEKDVILTDAHIVYDTGAHDAAKFSDAQKIASEWRIRTGAIESYGVTTKLG